ncbi:hypothetical protein HELRODRAFT_75665 [Helobdella robusta]|uniref:Rad4 beta-hairpin domain-containing protein n=1 Tax=Helobdella robusta TaxID=6412 RepID=T1G286_HELRO|nr:hypothetical protein HELRODRAFT_75665 [Helobdella robusta]ESO08232.1 hypothetical protein HELRODRAFT_75665 [Helobdella robusta]
MEEDLELFGRWQTEQFIPMPAIDGKVPKNEFGNVELFQPWMLPGGTVYIEGWVVCEEHKDILLSAWQDEQKRIRLEEKKKNEERIMNNWKILIKGVLIRERLRKDFNITVCIVLLIS